jgi:hypothetical protein
MENRYISKFQNISCYRDIYWYKDNKGSIRGYKFGGLEYKLRKIDLKFYGIYLEIRHGK